MGTDIHMYAEQKRQGQWTLIGPMVKKDHYYFLRSNVSQAEWQRIYAASADVLPKDMPIPIYEGGCDLELINILTGSLTEKEAFYGPGYQKLFTRPFPRDLSPEMHVWIDAWTHALGGSFEHWQQETSARSFLLSEMVLWDWRQIHVGNAFLEGVVGRLLDQTEDGSDVRVLCWFTF